MILTPCDQQKSDFWSPLSNYFMWFLVVLKTLMFILLFCHQVECYWDFILKQLAQHGFCCWKKSSFHKKLYSKNSADEREIFVRSGNSPPFPNERSEFCVFVQNSHICRFQLLLLSSITNDKHGQHTSQIQGLQSIEFLNTLGEFFFFITGVPKKNKYPKH